MADSEPPPPSYNDIFSIPEAPSGGSPSAPPIDAIGTPSYPPSPSPRTDHAPSSTGRTRERERLSTANQRGARATHSKADKILEAYVSFSMAHLLRMNIEPRGDLEDPELDVEAHLPRAHIKNQRTQFARRRRLQCVSGWLYCIGVVQVLVYITLPIAMILTGILGFNNCPFRSNTIIIYLLTGGSVLAVVVLLRIIPSIFTCCKRHNRCGTGQSDVCSACICTFECLFLGLFLISLALLILGSYWVFSERPISTSDCPGGSTDGCSYCSTAVYVGSAIYIVLQYWMFVFSALFMCVVGACHRHFTREVTRL